MSAVSIGDEAQPGIYALSNSPPHLEKLAFTTNEHPLGSTCPGPLTADEFSPLGIAMADTRNGTELVVINRGSRKSIERFALQPDSTPPDLDWLDCIPLPASVSANSVALLHTGEIFVTQAFDPRNQEAWEQRVRGEPTGQVYHWKMGQGWRPAPVARLSSPNGLAVDENGCFAVVAAWSTRRLVRQALPCDAEGAPPAQDLELKLAFMPDNLRWTDRGTLLVTGQLTTPTGLMDCVSAVGPCPSRTTVIEVDTRAMRIVREWHIAGGEELGLGTTALQVGSEIWFSSILGRRIGRIPAETP